HPGIGTSLPEPQNLVPNVYLTSFPLDITGQISPCESLHSADNPLQRYLPQDSEYIHPQAVQRGGVRIARRERWTRTPRGVSFSRTSSM
ncbi:MAG: hypothetical protein M1519_03045, partial [Actinobacteria bacterium]|nr:hypothetical protein [Actinomycetota bacterium]